MSEISENRPEPTDLPSSARPAVPDMAAASVEARFLKPYAAAQAFLIGGKTHAHAAERG